MEPTSQFFSKLRKLGVTLESETTRLQHAFENRNVDSDSGEADEIKTRGMRAYHELNSEVGNLKVQIQGELAEQKAKENEVSSFIKACKVMEQKVCKDIQTLRTHLEKYGYQAPIQKPIKPKDEATDVEEQDETNTDVGDDGSQEEDGEIHCSPAQKMEPPLTNGMRTPQLSDFGLSELQLKRALAGPEWCSEVPSMPEMMFPRPSLNTPAPPPMAITPKCTLRMDDDELQTPLMHDFGISEHTMCLNNDFTMDLFWKNVKNPKSQPQDIPEPSMNSVVKSLQTKADNLVSPELPVLCTPGLKIKKRNGECSPPGQSSDHPESLCRPDFLPTTPEVPAFQTPYMNRLVSTKKSARQPEAIDMQTDDDGNTFQTSPCNKAAGFKRSWESNVPHLSVLDMDVKQMPEMPNLESALGNSLQRSNGKILKMRETEKDFTINNLKLDGPTQEFNLRTPCIRTTFQEPGTPEMPDLSSVTQDICKLVSEAQMKRTAAADIHLHIQPQKDKHSSLPQAGSVSVVSQREFQALPNYLRRMNLSSLNQAVHNINRYSEEYRGKMKELTTWVLKEIIDVGTMAPVYILCLKELKRLEQVDGVLGSAVYKLITHN